MSSKLFANRLMNRFAKVLIVLLLVLSFDVPGNRVFAEEVIELEFGNEALEEYKTYQLDTNYKYISSDESVCIITDGLVEAVRFGEATIEVLNNRDEVVDTIMVIVYFVGNEQVPWASSGLSGPYVSGYPDGTFKPGNYVTRAEIAVMFCKILDLQMDSNLLLTDVQESYWGFEYVQKITSVDLFTSSDENKFYPDANISRRDIAMLISNYFAIIGFELDVIENNQIEDIGNTDFGFKAINEVVSVELLNLNDNKFYPDNLIRRDEAIGIINELIGRMEYFPLEPTYSDVPVTSPYYLDIEAASNVILD